MKKALRIAAVVTVGIAVLIFVSREKKVEITNLSWSTAGTTAPYAFDIANRTYESLTVTVRLEAQSVRESQFGTHVSTLGQAAVEVRLAPREEKTLKGVIDLTTFGDSGTRVSYTIDLKSHHD